MKQPNNTRNRWRRYRDARDAYGFAALPFASWVKGASADSYAARHGDRNENVRLFACNCRGRFFCICYRAKVAK